MAKAVLAAFVATVLLMLTLICVNTQIIRIKSVRVQDLEQQKEQLAQDIAELQSRIQAAQSEEAIREYALSNGMILGSN
jgi:outer membrane murein-binding lipoprotein Lpp